MSYFSVTLKTIITGIGKYKTRCGEVVSIESIHNRHNFGCRGVYSTGQTEGWHKSGRVFFGIECANDIVEVL